MSMALAAEAEPLLQLRDVCLGREGAARPLLDRLSLTLGRGETLVLVGESGCGKEALMALLGGQLAPGESLSGSIRFAGRDFALAAPPGSALRAAYLPGPAAQPFSPHASLLGQLVHLLSRRLALPRASARAELALALERMAGAPGLDALDALPARLAPDAIAYGLFALTFAQTPALVLADQPLAGLAPLPRRQLAEALSAARARQGFALLYAAMGTEIAPLLDGRMMVLRHGRVVEEGEAARLAGAKAHPYTRTLFRDVHDTAPPPASLRRGEPVLQVFALPQPEPAAAQDTLHFELRRGAALAFVGARRSGRHRLLNQIAAMERPRAGRVLFDSVDTGLLTQAMRMRLRRRIAYITGDDQALDARMTLSDVVAEPLRAHLRLPREVVAAYREAALKRVGLATLPGATPVAALSPFDRRRLQVARAIVTAPHLAILDEPLAGLDAFAQSVMRELIRTFRAEEGPAMILVTGDFAVARSLADSAFVFEAGRVVERGAIAELLQAPREAATRGLIAAADASRLPLPVDGVS